MRGKRHLAPGSLLYWFRSLRPAPAPSGKGFIFSFRRLQLLTQGRCISLHMLDTTTCHIIISKLICFLRKRRQKTAGQSHPIAWKGFACTKQPSSCTAIFFTLARVKPRETGFKYSPYWLVISLTLCEAAYTCYHHLYRPINLRLDNLRRAWNHIYPGERADCRLGRSKAERWSREVCFGHSVEHMYV